MKKIFFILYIFLSFYIQAQTLYISGTGSLYIAGAANIDGNIAAAPTLYVQGAVSNNGTLTNAGEIQQTGNFDNPGTFVSTGDNVFLTGATQNLSGGFTGSESFYNLVVNKSVNPVVLSSNVEVANQVNLVNGKISVGSLNLTLAPTATITGYDANDYIVTGSTGTLRQTVGASNVLFPVGISAYNPLTMSNAGTSDVFYIRVQDQVICQGNNPLVTTAKVNRRWNMTEATLGGSNATITVQWNTAEEDATFDRNQSGITTYDSSVPTYMLSATNTAAANPSAGVYTQTQTGQTLIGHTIVTSISQISAGGATTFCDGGNVLLTSPTDALFAYQWKMNGSNIGGANSSTYTADASGNYNDVITVNGTCTMTTSAITVTEQPQPTAPTIAFTNPATANTTITACANTPVTMASTTPNVYDYVWYKNGTPVNYLLAPNNSYTVNNQGAGTDVYTLYVSYIGNTCLSAQSTPLTIIKTAPPAMISVIGPTTFCVNTPSTLSANTGVNYSYTWKRSGTTVQSGASNTYMPTVSGNHNVTILDGSTNCSATSAWTNVTVNPLPVANAGLDKTVCEGTTVLIGTAGVAPNTYTWSPTLGLVSPYTATTAASPSNVTTYTLTVYNPTTTCSNTDAVIVTPLSAPPVPSLNSSTTPVCQGTTISMTAISSGAASVDWYKNNVFLYNKPTAFVQTVSTPTPAGDNYSIKAKGANGCFSAFSNIVNAWVKDAAQPTITSSPAAVGANVTICSLGGTSGTATLTANSTQASPAYSWKLAGNYIPGANTNTYMATVTTAANNKIYTVEATYPNGCIRTSANINVKVVTSGCTPKLGSEKDDAITVISNQLSVKNYPNPAQTDLEIEVSNSQSSSAKLMLYNTLGQVVLEKEIVLTNGAANTKINISYLAKGIYTLSLQTNNEQYTDKIVKE